MTRLMAAALFAGTACLSLESCCRSGIRSVEVYLLPSAGVQAAYVWPGDTLALGAVAGTDPREFCYHPLFTSAIEPDRFTYQSSNPSVATVTAFGELVAHNLGATTVTAMTNGVTSQEMAVIVGAPVGAIRFTPEPATIEVGDTSNVQIDALDSMGQVVVGAQVSFGLLRTRDSIATMVTRPRPGHPRRLATPVTIRILGMRPGIATLEVDVPRNSVRLTSVITATIDIPVAARPSSDVRPDDER